VASSGVRAVRDRFGSIPRDFFVFTPPRLPAWSADVALDIVYDVVAIASGPPP
jgi:SulP family sulfate permease